MTVQSLLKNKVAVVTGGGRGLGRELATALAEAGAIVAVTGRNEAHLANTVEAIKTAGGEAVAVPFDVTDQGAVDRSFVYLADKLGPIDLLINNAGYGGPIDCAWDVDPDDWWKTFEVNVRGSFLCSRAVLPAMVERREGSIINIVSHAGIHRWPLCSAYAVSKGALIKLSENLAAEVKRHDISVFSYHPGILKVGMGESPIVIDVDPNSPRGKIISWFHRQIEEGRMTPLEQSLATFMALTSGDYSTLSGCFIAAGDDLTAMLSAVEDDPTAGLYSLQLKS